MKNLWTNSENVRWTDHKRITYYACRSFGLSEEISRKIANASILPDKEPDYTWVAGRKRMYRKRIPHHSVEGLKKGLEYLKTARVKYVKGKDYTVDLGKALHYIQDYCVSITSKILIFPIKDYEAHEEWEREISSISLNHSDVVRGFMQKVFPHQFEDLILENGSKRDPAEALSIATYLSAVALKLVFNPDKPEDLEEKYSKKLKRHVMLTLGGFTVPFLIAMIHGLSLIACAFIGAISSYVLHKLDIPYHHLKFDRDWLLGK